ncbi:hypothetical protein GUD61_004717 [Salmonella enterica]|nr:hypothetical protein [Salmonella enterica]
MFRQIKISYGLVAVLILLTIIQIISGSWSVMSYRNYDRNLQQIAFERARIALLDEAYVIISDTRSNYRRGTYGNQGQGRSFRDG